MRFFSHKNRKYLLSLIDLASQLVVNMDQNDDRLKYVSNELNRIKELVKKHWVLTGHQIQSINIGLFAVRELEDIDHELAQLLMKIDYNLRNLKWFVGE